MQVLRWNALYSVEKVWMASFTYMYSCYKAFIRENNWSCSIIAPIMTSLHVIVTDLNRFYSLTWLDNLLWALDTYMYCTHIFT